MILFKHKTQKKKDMKMLKQGFKIEEVSRITKIPVNELGKIKV